MHFITDIIRQQCLLSSSQIKIVLGQVLSSYLVAKLHCFQ